jgi:hypothetical protein
LELKPLKVDLLIILWFEFRKEYTAQATRYLLRFLAEMVDLAIVGTLTWFHIFSVIGWTGAALTFWLQLSLRWQNFRLKQVANSL